jgi:hypothetical protein
MRFSFKAIVVLCTVSHMHRGALRRPPAFALRASARNIITYLEGDKQVTALLSLLILLSEVVFVLSSNVLALYRTSVPTTQQ